MQSVSKQDDFAIGFVHIVFFKGDIILNILKDIFKIAKSCDMGAKLFDRIPFLQAPPQAASYFWEMLQS